MQVVTSEQYNSKDLDFKKACIFYNHGINLEEPDYAAGEDLFALCTAENDNSEVYAGDPADLVPDQRRGGEPV